MTNVWQKFEFKNYNLNIGETDRHFVATIEEISELEAVGHTKKEACSNLEKKFNMWAKDRDIFPKPKKSKGEILKDISELSKDNLPNYPIRGGLNNKCTRNLGSQGMPYPKHIKAMGK